MKVNTKPSAKVVGLFFTKEYKMTIENVCEYSGNDIGCGDGVCPDCNYYNYLCWLETHLHCDTGSWDCPDDKDCPHSKGVAWVTESD